MKIIQIFAISIAIFSVAIWATEGENETPSTTPTPNLPDPGVAVRDSLWKELFTDYNKNLYPENTTVNFGIALIDVDFDVENNHMISRLWIRMVWSDNRLKWDKEKTKVDVMHVPPSYLWLPDIAHYNGVENKIDYTDFDLLLYPSGELLWVPPVTLKSWCSLNVTTHPYDEQICNLKFGSWTYSGEVMDFQLYKNETKSDMVDFYDNRKYNVTTNSAVRNVRYYSCCSEPYIDLTFTLGMTRNAKKHQTCSSAEAI